VRSLIAIGCDLFGVCAFLARGSWKHANCAFHGSCRCDLLLYLLRYAHLRVRH
jgi:hypothetical protein